MSDNGAEEVEHCTSSAEKTLQFAPVELGNTAWQTFHGSKCVEDLLTCISVSVAWPSPRGAGAAASQGNATDLPFVCQLIQQLRR
eukprot:scaffold409730_cov43-Prasinocladus_malaysianus.AAC.1